MFAVLKSFLQKHTPSVLDNQQCNVQNGPTMILLVAEIFYKLWVGASLISVHLVSKLSSELKISQISLQQFMFIVQRRGLNLRLTYI